MAAKKYNIDIAVAFTVILMVLMFIIPLPTVLLDFFMALNLTFSLVVLLIVLFTARATDFSVFPSLLLLSTIFGLVLNVSSTRLILSKGEAFDGAMIRAFSSFVIGASGSQGLVIGFVIFIILIAVQAFVITKGAKRVAEVSARFKLDSHPTKSMSIDAEYNAGIITDEEARQKKAQLQREDDFYGAMDGANQFVSGNVKVGIFITVINVIAGLIIGMVFRTESFSNALRTYTTLSIGDGLLAQLPSLFLSVATGLLVTRMIDEGSFGQDTEGALWADSPWSGGRFQTADLVERAPDGGFLLLGRKDRIIKFEDKRVSLTQIEHSLLQHEWIADAHCARHPQHGRIAAWAALSAEGIAALREQGRAAVVQTLKQHLAKTQDTAALPRYWRFAAALPRNPQAKIREQDFQTAFTVPQTAPQWAVLHANEETREYAFEGVVPLDLTYFGGHFADFPLVPGVIEVQWAMDLAARFDWGRKAVQHIENLKYQHFVRPNDTVQLTLRHDAAKNKIHFAIRQGDTPCASGRVVLHD